MGGLYFLDVDTYFFHFPSSSTYHIRPYVCSSTVLTIPHFPYFALSYLLNYLGTSSSEYNWEWIMAIWSLQALFRSGWCEPMRKFVGLALPLTLVGLPLLKRSRAPPRFFDTHDFNSNLPMYSFLANW